MRPATASGSTGRWAAGRRRSSRSNGGGSFRPEPGGGPAWWEGPPRCSPTYFFPPPRPTFTGAEAGRGGRKKKGVDRDACTIRSAVSWYHFGGALQVAPLPPGSRHLPESGARTRCSAGRLFLGQDGLPFGNLIPCQHPGLYIGGNPSMTTPLGARQRPAARLTRRQFLLAGGVGALAAGLPGTVGARVETGRGLSGAAAERSCIFVLLCGGPSHIDTWDLDRK